MKYCRINLSKTDYQLLNNYQYLYQFDINELNQIYKMYCEHKQFTSVMPIFDTQYHDTDVIGYYDNAELVAFSLVRTYDQHNAEALQFAWDYQNPKLRLGIESLKNECALYKARGFEYLYLGQADEYKSQLDGFELLGLLP